MESVQPGAPVATPEVVPVLVAVVEEVVVDACSVSSFIRNLARCVSATAATISIYSIFVCNLHFSVYDSSLVM